MDYFKISKFENLLKSTLDPFMAAALFNQDGKVICQKSFWPQDLGTLKNCLKSVKNYFPLKPGELVMTNESYLMGPHPFAISLVGAVVAEQQTFYLVIRNYFDFGFKKVNDSSKEGVKIPPLLIAENELVIKPLLGLMANAVTGAMNNNSNFGSFFAEEIERMVKTFFAKSSPLKDSMRSIQKKDQPLIASQYLLETQKDLEHSLSEMGVGEDSLQVQLDSGEILRLNFQFNGEGFVVDFAGTSNSDIWNLPEASTVGACMSGILSLFPREFLPTENFMKKIVVNIPNNCCLNAKPQSAITAGALYLAPLVSQMVAAAGAKVTLRKSIPVFLSEPSYLCFRSPQAQKTLSLAPGGCATGEQSGIDCSPSLFKRNSNQNTSIKTEKDSSLFKTLKVAIRKDSGGKGLFKGGQGQVRELEILTDLELSYFVPVGFKNKREIPPLKKGEPGHLMLLKKNGEKLNLTGSFGSVQLNTGDILIAATEGGAGYGQPEAL
jgi:N-methylhydantoinase B/oxoprolinase/acetone carboxylase alpha subunit